MTRASPLEAKNPDNMHHLVLANSTTQTSSLAATRLLHYSLYGDSPQLGSCTIASCRSSTSSPTNTDWGIVHRLNLVIIKLEISFRAASTCRDPLNMSTNSYSATSVGAASSFKIQTYDKGYTYTVALCFNFLSIQISI